MGRLNGIHQLMFLGATYNVAFNQDGGATTLNDVVLANTLFPQSFMLFADQDVYVRQSDRDNPIIPDSLAWRLPKHAYQRIMVTRRENAVVDVLGVTLAGTLKITRMSNPDGADVASANNTVLTDPSPIAGGPLVGNRLGLHEILVAGATENLAFTNVAARTQIGAVVADPEIDQTFVLIADEDLYLKQGDSTVVATSNSFRLQKFTPWKLLVTSVSNSYLSILRVSANGTLKVTTLSDETPGADS